MRKMFRMMCAAILAIGLVGAPAREARAITVIDPSNLAQNILQVSHMVEQLRNQVQQIEPLLVEVMRQGRRLADSPDIDAMRQLRQADVERLDSGVRRIMYPHIYHVSLSEKLWSLKQELIQKAAAQADGRSG